MKRAFKIARRIAPWVSVLAVFMCLHGPPVAAAPDQPPHLERVPTDGSNNGQLRLDILGGPGAYQYTPTCSSSQFRDRYLEGQARFRYRTGGNWVVAGQAAVMRTTSHQPDSGNDPNDPDQFDMSRAVGLRFGYDWRYTGVELGAVAGRYALSGSKVNTLLPSARLWVGKRDEFELWTSLLADETASLNRIAGFGITTRRPWGSFSGGLTGSAGDSGQGFIEMGIRVAPNLSLLLAASYGDDLTWSTLAGVSFLSF